MLHFIFCAIVGGIVIGAVLGTIWWLFAVCAATLDQIYLFCVDVFGPVGDLWRAFWSSKLGRILTTRIL